MKPNKTTENNNDVTAYLSAIADEKKRSDCSDLIGLISQETGLQPKMWGTAIVGFGSYHYKYDSGREGEAPQAALSARANAIAFYLSSDPETKETLLKKLGKHKTGKGCFYIQKLADIDMNVLLEMVRNSIRYHQTNHVS